MSAVGLPLEGRKHLGPWTSPRSGVQPWHLWITLQVIYQGLFNSFPDSARARGTPHLGQSKVSKVQPAHTLPILHHQPHHHQEPT